VEARPDGRDAATESTVVDGDAVEARPDGRDAATESTGVMEADELELLERTVRHALGSDADADDALEAIGWSDVLAAEPRDAVSVVFGALGDLHAVTSALDDVMLEGLGATTALGAALALPAFGEWEPPGGFSGGKLAIDGLTLARAARRDTVAVPARDGARVVLAFVPTDAMERTVVHGLAPELGMARLHADAAAATTTEILDSAAWADALAAGRRALATELVAAGRAMLGLAREHALTREQFGRPIAQFQAVRHRLAETYVALEAADAAVVSAWDAPDPMTAMLAKSLAGRGARAAATHCQQVLAGIGFTTEHPLHHFVKRVAVLDGLLGSSRRLPREVGASLLATRALPALLDL
jgi:alkylation response protein AidB-like acyl-CoA dehydrogenase